MHSVVPSKTISDSRPKWAKSIPAFRPKRRKKPPAKTLPDRAAHTYMACIREYPLALNSFPRGALEEKKMTVTLVGLAQALGDQHTPAHCMTAFVLFCFEDFFTPKT